MAVYYLDGTTLANSTAVYADENLTICESDWFYSDGNIVRQQVNCVLLNIQNCESCPEPPSGIFRTDIFTDCDFVCDPLNNYSIEYDLNFAGGVEYQNIANGDVVLGDVIDDGWYAIAETVMTTQGADPATFKILEIESNVVIDCCSECNGSICDSL